MFSSSASVFAVNHQARAICPQISSKERHRFLVGTCSLHEHNEISVLEYHEDSNAIDCPMVYSHPEQIWGMEPSPQDPALIITSWQSNSGSCGTTLWRMEHQTADEIESAEPGQYLGDRLNLDSICTFVEPIDNSSHSSIHSNVKWHPTQDSLLIASDNSVGLWSVDEGRSKKLSTYRVPIDLCQSRYVASSFAAGAIAWDPHAPKNCALGCFDLLQLIDCRSMSVTASVPKAHAGTIRDIDYNPNKPLTLVTAGDDRKVRFWDARNLKDPIKVLGGHSHWTWRVKYNPFHDQLLLSGSTDQSVILWRIASCSSAPWLGSDELDVGLENEHHRQNPFGDDADDLMLSSIIGGSTAGANLTEINDPPDIKVRHMDQHEESVYGVAWSPADAWIYCSMSFDGRIILNHVPSTEKYKILL